MGCKSWKNFMAKLYGFGASIVIIGAMFKIMHWPGAGPMLVVGLSTEAVIFFFSAFEPPHEEVDWSLVYPELAGMHGEEAHIEDKGSLTEQLDTMLEDAKIGPELIESLGSGIRHLSDQTSKLTNITDAGVASNEFANTIKSASESVGNLTESYGKAQERISSSTEELAKSYDKAKDTVSSSTEELAKSYDRAKDAMSSSTEDLAKSFGKAKDTIASSAEILAETYGSAKGTMLASSEKLASSYSKASQTMDALSNFNEESQSHYGQELQKVSKNLSALNASYELQLQSSNEQIKATSKFYDGLTDLMKNLTDSTDDTKRYKEQIAQLSNNLESLNTVYGNMLTAMRK